MLPVKMRVKCTANWCFAVVVGPTRIRLKIKHIINQSIGPIARLRIIIQTQLRILISFSFVHRACY